MKKEDGKKGGSDNKMYNAPMNIAARAEAARFADRRSDAGKTSLKGRLVP